VIVGSRDHRAEAAAGTEVEEHARGRIDPKQPEKRDKRENTKLRKLRGYVPRIYSIGLTLLGLFCALEAISGAFRRTARPVRAVADSLVLPATGNLAYAAVILLLAAAVARRKKVARRILLWIFGLTAVLELIALIVVIVAPAGDLTDSAGDAVSRTRLTLITIGSLAFAAIGWAGLLWAKREFYAPVRHASFRRALGVFLGLLAVGILIGWGLVSVFPGTLQTGAAGHLTYAASRVLGGVIRSGSGTIGHAPGWVNLLLGLFGAIAVLAGFATLMSSQRAEARLPVDSERREMRPVRQAVHRLERAGYTVTVSRHQDLSESEMAGAVHDANAWRDTESERGFSMALGRLGDPSDGDCVLVEAFDGNHTRTALLSLSPWGSDGLSLDLMRRAPDADNGTMERDRSGGLPGDLRPDAQLRSGGGGTHRARAGHPHRRHGRDRGPRADHARSRHSHLRHNPRLVP
jgi:Transmembrane region of lysyl-tRNA synthetase/Phosphatidylglycerol lysyltransferase, C-terminal